MLMVMILIVLHLLSKTPNYMIQLQIYQQGTTKNYQNFLAKSLEDQFIGMNIKQKLIIKIEQITLDIFLNQTLLQLLAIRLLS